MGFLVGGDSEKRITASTLVYNADKMMFIIELNGNKNNFIITTDMFKTEKIAEFEGRPILTRIIYDHKNKTYAVPFYDYCAVTDENFNEIEKIEYPKVFKYSDGGGMFPITYFNTIKQ